MLPLRWSPPFGCCFRSLIFWMVLFFFLSIWVMELPLLRFGGGVVPPLSWWLAARSNSSFGLVVLLTISLLLWNKIYIYNITIVWTNTFQEKERSSVTNREEEKATPVKGESSTTPREGGTQHHSKEGKGNGSTSPKGEGEGSTTQKEGGEGSATQGKLRLLLRSSSIWLVLLSFFSLWVVLHSSSFCRFPPPPPLLLRATYTEFQTDGDRRNTCGPVGNEMFLCSGFPSFDFLVVSRAIQHGRGRASQWSRSRTLH